MTVHDTHEEHRDEYPDQTEIMTDLSVDQEAAAVTSLHPTVGDELRMRREEAGHTINDVSESVRIQPRYLEALESGRLEDLPGTVYALGFLRTYAEHYGFNGDAFVTRFKEETEGLRQVQDYNLPEPIEEARVPTAAILIVAIVLAIGAYVAWYSLRSQETEIADAVPEVPAHLSAAPEETLPAPAPAETVEAPQPVAAEPVETPAAAPAATIEIPEVPEQPVTAEAPATVAETELPPAPESPPAAVEALVLPASPAEPEAPPAETPVTEAPVAEAPLSEASPAETPVVETPPAPPPVSEAPSAETPPAMETAAVTPPEAPATDTPSAPAVEETPYVPQSFGASNIDARIVITAAEDSWIEITDEEGSRLLSRTMRAGDSYRVPDRAGLVLVTGNAGGLDIAVDGAATPAIGDSGIVRKNVKLDPELLKQGRAWP